MVVKRTKIFNFVIFAAIFFFYLLPPVDTDLGWHLRYGKQTFENHSVWKNNQIGFYLTDYQWSHSYSLYQLTTFTVYKYFGFWGLSIIASLIISLTLLLILKSHQDKETLTIPSLLFFILISYPVTNLGYRSQLFSLLGVSLIYWFILNNKKFSPIQITGLAIVFALWANFHGAFILGLILLALYAFEKIIKQKKSEFFNISITILISTLATLINPFGGRIYQEIYRHSWYPLNKLIAEWLSPNQLQIPLIFLAAAAIMISLIGQGKSLNWFKKEKNIFLCLSWLFFTFLAFRAKRNLGLFAISSINLLAATINQKAERNHLFWKGIFFLIPLIILFWRLTHLPNLTNNWDSICQQSKWALPCQATEHLKKNPAICPKIFNSYEWGGYLSWHLPESKTFVDGRMPAWPTPEGKSPYTVYLEILQTRKGWNEKLNEYGADCLFIAKGTFMDLELKKNKNYPWGLIYQDETAVIYQKQN